VLEHGICSCISDLAAYQPENVGKSTENADEDRLEQSLETVPTAECVRPPQPYDGDATSGLTRTVSPHEQLVSEHEIQQ
jgi:hypothetical protein